MSYARNLASTTLLPLLVTCVLRLAACSVGGSLDRPTAKYILNNSAKFQQTDSIYIRTGIVTDAAWSGAPYVTLRERGFLSAHPEGCVGVSPDPLGSQCWNVKFKNAQGTISPVRLTGDNVYYTDWQVKVATKQVLGVTGIFRNDHIAEVEFTWAWEPSNELGGTLYPKLETYKAKAVFKEYDDGWRVMEVKAANSESP